MWAKTGTLDEVNALSGYVSAASGVRWLSRFSSTAAIPAASDEDQAIDRIAEAIAAAE